MPQKITKNQIETQEAWITPTLTNGWVAYGGVYGGARYMKDSLGFVHLQGFLKGGTTTAGTAMFTLPAGYRPAVATYQPGVSSPGSAFAAFAIMDTGAVQFIAGNNTYISLGHVVFKAEQ